MSRHWICKPQRDFLDALTTRSATIDSAMRACNLTHAQFESWTHNRRFRRRLRRTLRYIRQLADISLELAARAASHKIHSFILRPPAKLQRLHSRACIDTIRARNASHNTTCSSHASGRRAQPCYQSPRFVPDQAKLRQLRLSYATNAQHAKT